MFINGGSPIAAVGNGLVLTSGTLAIDFADQTVMETGTSTVKIPSVAMLNYLLGIAKVVAFVSQAAGTYTLQSPSKNVASINKTGTGVIQVNFTTPFSATSSMVPVGGVSDSAVRFNSPNITSTSQVTVNIVRSSTEVAADSNFTLLVFGDQ